MAENDAENKVSRPPADSPRRFTATVRSGHVLAALFLFLAALCLAYIGGVMTGRHSGTARDHAPAPNPAPTQASAPENPDQRILAPEDLGFARALRNLPSLPRNSQTPTPAPQPDAPQRTNTADTAADQNPEGTQAAASATPNSVASEKPVTDGQIQPAARPLPNEGVLSDYVFQVGAFRDEKSVDALRQRLEGRGLRTRMLREGKFYLVQVLLRGNEERAAEVTAIVEELRLGKPILRSRKPVGLN